MGIALKIIKSAPSWAVCDPIKLLAINNRLSEAMDTLYFDDMALTKIEKFLLRRAFNELRKAKRREELKAWALHYAMTGEDTRKGISKKDASRMMEEQAKLAAYQYPPQPQYPSGSILGANMNVPQNGVNKVTLSQMDLRAQIHEFMEEQRRYEEEVKRKAQG